VALVPSTECGGGALAVAGSGRWAFPGALDVRHSRYTTRAGATTKPANPARIPPSPHLSRRYRWSEDGASHPKLICQQRVAPPSTDGKSGSTRRVRKLDAAALALRSSEQSSD
jgi:hypothetical protein